MILLLIMCSQLMAYEDIFKLKTENEIHEHQVKSAESQWLKEKCKLDKRRGGLIWACYLNSDNKVTQAEMDADCNLKSKSIRDLKEIPSNVFLRQLPQRCQKLLNKQRQVLAYKAKGI